MSVEISVELEDASIVSILIVYCIYIWDYTPIVYTVMTSFVTCKNILEGIYLIV